MLDQIRNHVNANLANDAALYSDAVFDVARGRRGPFTPAEINDHHARMHRLKLAADDFAKHVELARRFDAAVGLASIQDDRKARLGQATQNIAQFKKANAAIFDELARLERVVDVAKDDVEAHADEQTPDQVRSIAPIVCAGSNH